MEKPELTAVVAKSTGLSQVEASKIVDAYIETIKEALLSGEKVSISGFGTFMLSKKQASA